MKATVRGFDDLAAERFQGPWPEHIARLPEREALVLSFITMKS